MTFMVGDKRIDLLKLSVSTECNVGVILGSLERLLILHCTLPNISLQAGLVTTLNTRTTVFGVTNPKGHYDPTQRIHQTILKFLIDVIM